jgi:DNA-binding NarL/FixJ family response regulator
MRHGFLHLSASFGPFAILPTGGYNLGTGGAEYRPVRTSEFRRNDHMKAAASAVMSHPRNGKSVIAPLPRKRPESLTGREQEILELIWSGLKNREIGQQLAISVKTVEAHRANMMKKVRVSNTAQLLKAAIQDGLLKIR